VDGSCRAQDKWQDTTSKYETGTRQNGVKENKNLQKTAENHSKASAMEHKEKLCITPQQTAAMRAAKLTS